MNVPFQVSFNATFDSEQALRQYYGPGPHGAGGRWKGGRHGGNASSAGFGGAPAQVAQAPISAEELGELYGYGHRGGGYYSAVHDGTGM